MRKLLFSGFIVSHFLFFHASTSHAAGFLIYNQHAAANASAIAYAAQVDNPSAVFYNPAALNQLKGTQVSSGGVILIPHTKFKSDNTGKTTHMKDHVYLLPTFYLTHKINERFSLGIGSFSHFGLCTDWHDNWEGKFISTFAALETLFLNPVISCQVHPRLSLAAGFNVVYSELRFKRALNPKPLPIELGRADLDTDGVDYGFNLALLYQITDSIKLGVPYRSSIEIEYKGDADFKANSLLKPLLPEGGVTVDIELPPILATGISAIIAKKWTIEFDLIWIGFSTYDELFADFKEGVNPLIKDQFAPIPRDYKDVIDYAVSVKYQVNESLSLRCGFLFDRSPVPEENLDPILPDPDKYIVGTGLSLNRERWNFHLSYYAVFCRDTTVRRNRDGLNGKHEAYCSLISMSLDFKPTVRSCERKGDIIPEC